jgi:FKBP-type peptidyl-prolyl cis-trans isomerase FkpA
MKQLLYAFMAFCAFGLLSCRKSSDNFTIKQFDDNQIQTYIKQNGLTGMVKDTSGGDTTGIYYQILNAGSGKIISYPDKIPYTFSVKSLDGKFNTADTIFNHQSVYAAYVAPLGLQLGIINILKHKGGKMRLLIPSRLAYGTNGTTITTASSTTVTTTATIEGNQCLDITVTLIDDDVAVVNNTPVNEQAVYDDISIQNYLKARGLTALYTKTSTGVYYRVTQAGTGSDPISLSTTVGVDFTGLMLNDNIAEDINTDDGTAATQLTLYDALPAWQQVLPLVTAGAKISIISPSALTYGPDASTTQAGFVIPAFSCMRYEFNVISVQN